METRRRKLLDNREQKVYPLALFSFPLVVPVTVLCRGHRWGAVAVLLAERYYINFYSPIDILFFQMPELFEKIADTDMSVRSSSENVGTTGHGPKKGMVLPFQPLSLAFHHVNYSVDMPAVSYRSLSI